MDANANISPPTDRRVAVPSFHATRFHTLLSTDNCLLVLSQPACTISKDGLKISSNTAVQPVAIMNMSPQSAKTLCSLLGAAVEKYEAAMGVIKMDEIFIYTEIESKRDSVPAKETNQNTETSEMPDHQDRPEEVVYA